MRLRNDAALPAGGESPICKGGCNMASGQTENYGLNQWAAEDAVLREEFNRDNAKIDTLLTSLSNRFFYGTYNCGK